MNLYTVKDLKAAYFLDPLMSKNDETAKRSFLKYFNQIEHIQQYPEDYSIFQIGTFDIDTGEVVGFKEPIYVISALELMELSTTQARHNGKVQRSQEEHSQVGDVSSV